MSAARKANLDLLRDAVEPDQKPSFDNEGIAEALFHIVQGVTNDFGGCAVTVGSKYATELIYQAVFDGGRMTFEKNVQVVNGDPILRKARVASA